jgi:hypothetical protein
MNQHGVARMCRLLAVLQPSLSALGAPGGVFRPEAARAFDKARRPPGAGAGLARARAPRAPQQGAAAVAGPAPCAPPRPAAAVLGARCLAQAAPRRPRLAEAAQASADAAQVEPGCGRGSRAAS